MCLFCDGQSAIHIGKNPIFHEKKMKHVKNDSHMIMMWSLVLLLFFDQKKMIMMWFNTNYLLVTTKHISTTQQPTTYLLKRCQLPHYNISFLDIQDITNLRGRAH